MPQSTGPRGTSKQGYSEGFAIWRQPRPEKKQASSSEEEDAVVTQGGKIFKKKPESRLKWLVQAIFQAARKKIPVVSLYDIIADEKFAAGAGPKIIAAMKSQVEANLHMFSKKQQEFLRSSAFKPSEQDQSARSVDAGSDRRDDKSSGQIREGRHRRADAERRSPERRRDASPPPRVASRSRSRSNHLGARNDRSRSRSNPAARNNEIKGGRRCAASRSRSCSSRRQQRVGRRR